MTTKHGAITTDRGYLRGSLHEFPGYPGGFVVLTFLTDKDKRTNPNLANVVLEKSKEVLALNGLSFLAWKTERDVRKRGDIIAVFGQAAVEQEPHLLSWEDLGVKL